MVSRNRRVVGGRSALYPAQLSGSGPTFRDIIRAEIVLLIISCIRIISFNVPVPLPLLAAEVPVLVGETGHHHLANLRLTLRRRHHASVFRVHHANRHVHRAGPIGSILVTGHDGYLVLVLRLVVHLVGGLEGQGGHTGGWHDRRHERTRVRARHLVREGNNGKSRNPARSGIGSALDSLSSVTSIGVRRQVDRRINRIVIRASEGYGQDYGYPRQQSERSRYCCSEHYQRPSERTSQTSARRSRRRSSPSLLGLWTPQTGR